MTLVAQSQLLIPASSVVTYTSSQDVDVIDGYALEHGHDMGLLNWPTRKGLERGMVLEGRIHDVQVESRRNLEEMIKNQLLGDGIMKECKNE